MSFLNVKNRAESTLASGISDSDLSLTVATGEGALFPTSNFNITIEDEILFCSSRSTDVLTVVRAQEETIAAAHASGKAVELRITAGVVQNLERGCGRTNTQTLSADKALTPGTDPIYQFLDVDGANRNIALDKTVAKAGDRFVIRNTADYNDLHYLQIKNGTSSYDKIYNGTAREYIYDGSNWVVSLLGGAGYGLGMAIGLNARATDAGIAIGKDSIGEDYGSVAIGVNAEASSDMTVAIGEDATADAISASAIGVSADVRGFASSIAMGYGSQAYRSGDFCLRLSSSNRPQAGIVIFNRDTANDTPAEIFCAGRSNERFNINVESVVSFVIQVIAIDEVTFDSAIYQFKGGIKRDGSNNTTLLTTTKEIIHEDDASWDVEVTADDTNDSLKIMVTGDADNDVKWVIRVDYVEVHIQSIF